MVATHPHADHVAGLPAVLARFPVGLVVDPGCRGSSPYYAEFLRAVRSVGVPFGHPRPRSNLRVGDLTLQVLGPFHCASGTDSDPNNDSEILRIVDGPASVMFPGDAEQPEQTEVLQREAGRLGAALLKVPHHGGNTSLGAFFRAVHASVATPAMFPASTSAHTPVTWAITSRTTHSGQPGTRAVCCSRSADATSSVSRVRPSA